MRTAKDNIAQMLKEKIENKKQERAQNLSEYEREKEAAKEKITMLINEQSDAETPERYKEISEQIHEQEDYISFLEWRTKKANETPLLSLEEFEETKAQLNAENEKTLDACADNILKKFDELTAMLDEYTQTANDLQDVLELAELAHFKRKLGGHFWHALREKRPNPYGVYSKMLLAYLNHRANELRR